MKKSFFLMIFLSFYFLSQSVQAAPYDYVCDSRENTVCSECPPRACDYRTDYVKDGCSENNCLFDQVLIDCLFAGLYNNICINLECGNAGIADAHKCEMKPDLDSVCVNVDSKSYGWVDNTEPFSCTCYETQTAGRNQYNNKDAGTFCRKDGYDGECKNGVCETIITPTTCITPCIDGTPCEPPTCSDTYPGQRCVDNGLGVGELVVDTINCPITACTKCSDNTAVGACSSANPGKKCSEVNGVCSLYTDSNCATTVCSSKNNAQCTSITIPN